MPALRILLGPNGGAVVSKRATPDWADVKDYGAVGDAIHDDTIAFQAAVDASPECGTVYVPQGVFVLSRTIDTGSKIVHWVADPGPLNAYPYRGPIIVGKVVGPLIRTIGPSVSGTGPTIRGLSLLNTAPTGGHGIWFEALADYSIIRDCQVTCTGTGLYMENVGGVVDACVFSCGVANAVGSRGMLLQNRGTTVINPDVTGFEVGIQVSGVAAKIIGGRLENNNVAVMNGVNAAGLDGAGGLVMFGTGFEANDTAIEIHHGSVNLQSVNVLGSEISPSGQSIHAIYIPGYADNSVLMNCAFAGSYRVAAFKCTANPQVRFGIYNSFADNTLAPNTLWDTAGSGIVFTQCNN